MNEFRPETFTQFVRKMKPVWFLKVIWAFAFVFLTVIFFWTYKTDHNTFFTYLVFIFIGLTIQAAFIYSVTYKIYALGRKAFLQVNNENLEIIPDSKVYIKGFDLYSKKSFFNIDVSKPVYDFNQAELLLSGGSIILLGSIDQFGSRLFAAPVEIAISDAKTSIAHAKLVSWEDKNGRVVIELKDGYYTKPVKIEFKNHYQEIKLWLTRHCPKAV